MLWLINNKWPIFKSILFNKKYVDFKGVLDDGNGNIHVKKKKRKCARTIKYTVQYLQILIR